MLLSTVTPAPAFSWIDWLVLAAYMLVVIGIGIGVSMGRTGRREYFLAGRSIPMWAAAVSVLATALSAATFIGGPQQAYRTNLTYFVANVGGLIAVLIAGIAFIPAYYRMQVTSIYEVLGRGMGPAAQRAASGMFMLGRVFASGARLFMVAIPFSYIAFNDIESGHLMLSIALIAVGATLYTMIGGIRAVIWTDVVQATVFVACVAIALLSIWSRIPASTAEVVDALRNTPLPDQPSVSKLTILDGSLDPTRPYTIWAALIGWSLFNLAAFGTDQDLVQRMLTCRDGRRGTWSVIVSNFITWPVVGMFLVMGLLLYVFYQRPDLMGDAAPSYVIDDSRTVFLDFILHEMGPGMRGLMVAGLFAAAMSTLDSTLNALASTTITDFVRPFLARARPRTAEPGDARVEAWLSRLFVLLWSIVLGTFACVCIVWQARSGMSLIDFALNVMLFAYTGLLAVFVAALFTNRGNSWSAIAALATGFLTIVVIQTGVLDAALAPALDASGWSSTAELAIPWQMCVGVIISFAVVCCGRRRATAAGATLTGG